MLTIHATKKLHTRLPINSNGYLPACESVQANTQTDNPLSGWHANLLLVQRRNCVLMAHDATRFPIFIKGLSKADFTNFQWHFEDALMNTLLKIDANQQQMDNAAALLGPCRFDTNCNRSVQGTMNQMAGDFDYMLRYDNVKLEDISTYSTAAWLADRPCTVKGMKAPVWPHKAMLELLTFSH